MRNLLKMYELAAAGRIEPVPVTVPSIRAGDDLRSEEGCRWFAGTSLIGGTSSIS